MEIIKTSIAGVNLIESAPFVDTRGSFSRIYCEQELGESIGSRRIVQINYSKTVAVGVVRGMHYQNPPHAEMKFIRCIKGSVWDVAVDLRANSSTLLKWHAEELTSENARMLVIPEGCAHGFQSLEPNSELLYLHTAFYTPEMEDGIAYNDPRLKITWPLPVTDLSARDKQFSPIPSSFSGIRV
jgi:dTDP-4-dehydrorhamnose 3,5-epimerase